VRRVRDAARAIAALGLLLATGSTGCGSTAPADLPGEDTAAGLDREVVLGDFLASHWELPVPPQGEAPSGWPPLETSLAPRDCGTCHPAQYAQWESSLHADAYSPGFSGQLVEGSLAGPAEVRQCQTCHAPLAEQQPHLASGEENPAYDGPLREQGIVCAACHVRAHRRFGPPRRPGLPPVADPLPHGGFEARPEFGESRFCAECHQFFDDPGVNGKPVQNTWAEWRASPAAAQGRTCQGCHMPDRAHRWRGIHDPETVRAAVEVELRLLDARGDALRAELALHSRDVGHHFPTYVTPRVFLEAWQEDAAGRELAGTRVEDVVGREIDFGRWEEVFDTRIPAGGSRVLAYAEPRRPEAVALAARVRVDPDFHYRGVFASLGEAYETPAAREKIAEAHRRTRESGYVLRELRRALDPPARGKGP